MLKRVKLNNFIHEDYITDVKVCDKLIKWFHSTKKFHLPGNVGTEGKVNAGKKLSTDFSFNLLKAASEVQVVEDYVRELQQIFERYLQKFSFANDVTPFGLLEKVNIQHYKPYEGFKIYHFERAGPSTIWRHLVFQTYLNTVKDGGETEFFYQQYKCKAVKGKTLIWPVDWTHTHRGIVSPTQDKYIITGWYSFDQI